MSDISIGNKKTIKTLNDIWFDNGLPLLRFWVIDEKQVLHTTTKELIWHINHASHEQKLELFDLLGIKSVNVLDDYYINHYISEDELSVLLNPALMPDQRLI